MPDLISLLRMEKTHIPAVYELVRELATFEKEPEAVTATITDYETAFDQGLIFGHVAVLPDYSLVGMTLYYETFSTWKGKMLYLEDFYIKENYRNAGIGKKLFEAYMEEGKIRKCSSLKWQVLDWNINAIAFYEKYGAIIQKDWWTCRLYM